MSIIVQKFGGSSLESVERIQNVASILAQKVRSQHKLVVTVSAMGKQTDALVHLAYQLNGAPPKRELDMLLTTGERVSASLLSMACHKINLRTISLTGSQCGILTDAIHGNARIREIRGQRILESLKDYDVVIVAGFQGVHPESREITTLGRGGSDLTAVALTQALKAESCEIYSDVAGVYTADPRWVPSARLIKEMSWSALCRMTCYGARVIHPRAAFIAQKYRIPLYLYSSFDPERYGTLVKGNNVMEEMTVWGISHRDQLTLVTLKLADRQMLSHIVHWLWQQGESSLWQSLEKCGEGYVFKHLLPQNLYEQYHEHLSTQNLAQIIAKEGDLAAISVVGEGFWQNPELLNELEECVENPHLIQVDHDHILLCIDRQFLSKNLQALHDRYLMSQ